MKIKRISTCQSSIFDRTGSPMSILSVVDKKLVIDSILLWRYSFVEKEVVQISVNEMDKHSIRIDHNKIEYPLDLYLSELPDADKTIRAIQEAGFTPKGIPVKRKKKHGFPLKVSAIVTYILIWNILGLTDYIINRPDTNPHFLSALALGLSFIITLGIPRFKLIEKIFMKEGRHAGEIRPILSFMTFLFLILFLPAIGIDDSLVFSILGAFYCLQLIRRFYDDRKIVLLSVMGIIGIVGFFLGSLSGSIILMIILPVIAFLAFGLKSNMKFEVG